jgi:hypothetical protein
MFDFFTAARNEIDDQRCQGPPPGPPPPFEYAGDIDPAFLGVPLFPIVVGGPSWREPGHWHDRPWFREGPGRARGHLAPRPGRGPGFKPKEWHGRGPSGIRPSGPNRGPNRGNPGHPEPPHREEPNRGNPGRPEPPHREEPNRGNPGRPEPNRPEPNRGRPEPPRNIPRPEPPRNIPRPSLPRLGGGRPGGHPKMLKV